VVECLSYGGHWVSNDRLFLLLRYYLLQNEIRGGAAYSFAPAWGGIREAGGYRSLGWHWRRGTGLRARRRLHWTRGGGTRCLGSRGIGWERALRSTFTCRANAQCCVGF